MWNYLGHRLTEASNQNRFLGLLHLIEEGQALGLEFGDGDFLNDYYIGS